MNPACPRIAMLALLGGILVAQHVAAQPHPSATHDAVIDLDNRFGDMTVERVGDDYRINVENGPQGLTPRQFVEIIEREKRWQQDAGFIFVIFNITTWWGLLWVCVGLLGQLLFTFRMVLQWLASEKQHKSVVPVGFWWGSLIGGLMLLTYFVWRKDAIGILGQSTGAFIYARNLWLIYGSQRRLPSQQPAAPAPAADRANAHA